MQVLSNALTPHQTFIEKNVSAIAGPDDQIDWASDQWKLFNGLSIKLDGFNELSITDTDPYTNIDISTADLARLLLSELTKTGSNLAKVRYKLLLCLFTIIEERKGGQLDKKGLNEVAALFLSSQVVNGRLRKTAKIMSYVRAQVMRSLIEINAILTRYDLPKLIFPGIKLAHIDKAIKDSFNELSFDDLSYSEWRDGGSFDTLTLDMGRFYAHYNLTFFEENLATAVAVKHTYRMANQLAERLGYKGTKEISAIVGQILGGQLAKAGPDWKRKFPKEKLPELRKLVTQTYVSKFDETTKKIHLQSEDTVLSVAEKLGLESQPEDIDRLGALLFHHSIGIKDKSLKRLLRGFKNPIELDKFKATCASELKNAPNAKIPSAEFYEQLGFVEGEIRGTSQPSYQRFLKSVRSSGLTACVALTGWRGSEFGFPLGAIREQPNDDAIDQYSTPIRYTVFWHVFKTAKDTLQQREVTLKVRKLMQNMSLLIDAPEDRPALYDSTGIADSFKPNVSHNKVKQAVFCNWARFVEFYQPFKNLREGTALLREHGENARSKFPEFDWDQYERCANDRLIYQNWRRATGELTAVSMHLDKRGKNWVEEYWRHQRGEPNELSFAEIAEIESRVPENLRQFLSSTEEVGYVTSRQFADSLIEDCLYPTPHAFRHMWAEAVYRRFDGDAGWMIRSNFKHVSKRMWLAYIRNKGNRREPDLIKSRVCSGLVKTWLREEGRGFTGKFHKYLSRILSSTNISSNEELAGILDEVVSRDIISVNANPWGYCLVRRSTERLSKCAVDGLSRTENATPSLCMSCINFLSGEGNVDYIIFSSYEHLELLKSEHLEDVPAEFVEASRDYIKQASARIRELDPSHQILSAYNDALEIIDTTLVA